MTKEIWVRKYNLIAKKKHSCVHQVISSNPTSKKAKKLAPNPTASEKGLGTQDLVASTNRTIKVVDT